jgi:L-serine dehydratase
VKEKSKAKLKEGDVVFKNIKELIKQSKEYSSVGELMIEVEKDLTGRDREEIIQLMERNLEIMKSSINEGLRGNKSVTGLTGGDSKRLNHHINTDKFLSGETILKAVRNGIAVNEVNGQMGLICATPTAGSAGCVPGVLMAAIEKLNLSHQDQLEFLFAAGAFGLVIANNASISGAEGGCQAEVGSASAMASAALVLASGGTVEEASHALAMTLKNTLGLICDPVAGLVEVPCVHRNALGTSLAFISADMALAGIKSVIPPDEVIVCMYQVGKAMPGAFKETAEGGLATTPTGRRLREEIFG